MKILIGDTRSRENIEVLQRRRWGRMFVAEKPTPTMYEPWGFDNLAFKSWQDADFHCGLTIDDWCILWDAAHYEDRLQAAYESVCDPYIAIVPDIPGSPHSLEWSLSWMSDLPRDWPWYLAVQDGMTHQRVAEVAHLFQGLFLGGSDAFKLTAYGWAKLAHACGKKFHYGRAGTRRKVHHAHAVGADSLDSSYPLWTKPRFRQFQHWIDGLGLQSDLELIATCAPQPASELREDAL